MAPFHWMSINFKPQVCLIRKNQKSSVSSGSLSFIYYGTNGVNHTGRFRLFFIVGVDGIDRKVAIESSAKCGCPSSR